jgi:hypothetical protein
MSSDYLKAIPRIFFPDVTLGAVRDSLVAIGLEIPIP